MTSEEARLKFEQICETARHYGNMRFAMFTVFTVILGSLFAVELGTFGSLPDGLPVVIFRIASLVLTVSFGLAEWRVAQLVVFYQEQADSFDGDLQLPLPKGHWFWKCGARMIMLTPFILAFLFWIVSLICCPTELVLRR